MVSRDELHRIVDQLPEDKLPSLADLLEKLCDEDDAILSVAEAQEIEQARARIESGEYVTLNELLQDDGSGNQRV